MTVVCKRYIKGNLENKNESLSNTFLVPEQTDKCILVRIQI